MRKTDHNFYLLSFILLLLFSSCSSTKYGAHFQSSPRLAGEYHADDEKGLAPESPEKELAIAVTENEEAEKEKSNIEGVASLKMLVKNMEMPKPEDLTARQQKVLKDVRERLANMSAEEKRELRRQVRKIKLADYMKELPTKKELGVADTQQTEVNILALILAIFIPPLGVLVDQGTTNKFWISLVLTILGVTSFLFIPALGLLPAIIYSVLVVLGIL